MTDYQEIHSNVETELRTLQAKKEQLEQQRQNIEQRLDVINRHEDKLRRVADSLADLLAVGVSAQAKEVDSASLAADAVEPSVIEQTEPQQGTDSSTGQKKTAAPTETDALSSTELQVPFAPTEASESLAPSVPSAQGLEEGQSSPSATTISHNDVAVLADIGAKEEAVLRQVADFDPQDFLASFPYITTTHPVHFLAGKLLEYFGYGLKLVEIARLIELLGYRHNSRNFTDSVHSALKNKRKTTGEFLFNARKSVWELSHWAGNGPVSVDSVIDKADKTAGDKTPVVGQPRQAEGENNGTSLNSRETAKPSPKKVAGNKSGKKGTDRPIKILKSQR
jgi:hypothetical protein